MSYALLNDANSEIKPRHLRHLTEKINENPWNHEGKKKQNNINRTLKSLKDTSSEGNKIKIQGTEESQHHNNINAS